MNKKPQAVAPKKTAKKNVGWQAEKSALTRKSILDAAVQCFIELGYASTTTALIAEYAGVSRGAMMHHFPSRSSVLKAAIEHIHGLRLQEYKLVMANIDNPDELLDRARIERSVKAAMKYHQLPSSVAFQEVLMASRTDVELRDVLEPLEREYEQEFMEIVKSVFPHWKQVEFDVLETAHDVVHFLIDGMLYSHMQSHAKQRSKRLLEFVVDSLERIYTDAGLTSE